jgi:hypothetical protein
MFLKVVKPHFKSMVLLKIDAMQFGLNLNFVNLKKSKIEKKRLEY